MSINNTQSGHCPSELLIGNNENESNTDQLLSAEVISASQPSSAVAFNPINMIPSQTSLLSNIQPQNTILSSHQQQFPDTRRHEQRQQPRNRYDDPAEHRYIGYMLRLYERNSQRYQQELDEQEHQAYLQRRSPTFDEMADQILQERELEEYYLERMTPQARQEIWEQQLMNELDGNPVPQAAGLPLDNVQQYANFLQEQLRQDEHEQTMRVYDMQNEDYAEECRKNRELFMQKEQWEGIAFRHQHL